MDDRELLREITEQLDQWVTETKTGGWSGHLVGPMRSLSLKISAHLVKTIPKKAIPKEPLDSKKIDWIARVLLFSLLKECYTRRWQDETWGELTTEGRKLLLTEEEP